VPVWVLLAALVLVLAGGCAQEESSSSEIELEERNGSGISGRVELEPVGERRTRITVVDVDGGEITGVRVMPESCSADGMDDKYPITPPSGVVQIRFEELRRWDEERPFAAAFMRRGRLVACGET
jgi:hypothetical protein